MTSPRDRLLDAAGELFDRQGVGVGVDALCRAAGVSKRSMYQLFAGKDELSAGADHRGCPLVATAVELKDAAHPANSVARRHKQAMTDFFAAEARAAGVADPDTLAVQLTLVFDGASARAVVRAEPLAGLGTRTAEALLDAAGA